MSLARFLADRKGSIAPMFALAVVPIMGLVGSAIDYSSANAARSGMQAAADAAALTLAGEAKTLSADAIAQRGADYFNANFTRSNTTVREVTASYSPQTSTITVTASGSMKSSFLQLFNMREMPIGVRTAALVAKDGQGCVLSLSSGTSGATTIQGTAAVNLKGCNLYDNSSDSAALAVGGSASLAAQSVGVVGGISGKAEITAGQGIYTGLAPIADPYATAAYPAFGACRDVNVNIKRDTSLDPGVYCQGISVNAGATLTLNPGIYYIDRGTFSVNGGATVIGTGVTIVFTSSTGSNYAGASFNGGASINLTAPTSGPTQGIVLFGDRNMPVGTVFKFEGGAAQNLTGAIYAPQAAVSYAGGADATDGCTKLVASTVKFTGNSNFAIDCTGLGTKPIGSVVAHLTN